MNSIKIYIATHKNFSVPYDNKYIPIIAGKKVNGNLGTEFIGDDTGDNISHLNNKFCELTVLYWIWKNDFDSKIIGLNHYRRFFEKKIFSTEMYINENNTSNELSLIKGKEIAAGIDFSEINDEIDIVVSKHFVGDIIGNYGGCHKIEDFFLIERLIKEICPEYIDAYKFYTEKCQYIYRCNMFVGKSNVIKDYCKWLFSILLAMKDYRCFKNYDDYQSRVFGFMSERMFGIWLTHNRNKLCLEERKIIEI